MTLPATLRRLSVPLAIAAAGAAALAPAGAGRADPIPDRNNGDVIAAYDYQRGAAHGFEIRLQDLTSGRAIALPDGLVNTPANETGPRLSEDGSRLAFARGGVAHVVDLRAGRDITPAVLLRHRTPWGVGLSPDGARVLVGLNALRDGVPGAAVVDVGSGDVLRVTGTRNYAANGDAWNTGADALGNGSSPLVAYRVYFDGTCQAVGFDSSGFFTNYVQLVKGSRVSRNGFQDASCVRDGGVIGVDAPEFGATAISSVDSVALEADDDLHVIGPDQDWSRLDLVRRPPSAPEGVNTRRYREHSPSWARRGRFLGFLRAGRTPVGDPAQWIEVHDQAARRLLRLADEPGSIGLRITTTARSVAIAQDPTRTSYPSRDSQAPPVIPDRVPAT